MFYLLIGKLWIKSIQNNKDLFYLFTYGAVFYMILHAYLNSRETTGVLYMIKTYFYYIMVIDFVVTYCLLSNKNKSEEFKDDVKLCTDQERQEIIKRLNEINKKDVITIEQKKEPLVEQKELFIKKNIEEPKEVTIVLKQDSPLEKGKRLPTGQYLPSGKEQDNIDKKIEHVSSDDIPIYKEDLPSGRGEAIARFHGQDKTQ